MAVRCHYIKKENFLGAKNKNVEQMYRVLLLAKIRFGVAYILYIYIYIKSPVIITQVARYLTQATILCFCYAYIG